MGNESGTWVMYGVEWDDPECIHTVDEAIEYINNVFCKHFLDIIAKYFWTLLQNVFGHCCMSKLDNVAMPRLAT